MAQAVTPVVRTEREWVHRVTDRPRTRRNRVLAVAAAVLLVGVAVVAALGNWRQTPDPAPTSQAGAQTQAVDPAVEALLDDLTAAINAADPQAVLGLLTDDASYFGTPVTATDPAGLVIVINRHAGYKPARDGTVALVVDDGFDYAIAYRVTVDSTPELVLARARLVDGALKIYEVESLKSS